jgi:hypothetical protein
MFLTTARNQHIEDERGNVMSARVRVIAPAAAGGSLPDILDTSRAFNSSVHQASERSPLSDLL